MSVLRYEEDPKGKHMEENEIMKGRKKDIKAGVNKKKRDGNYSTKREREGMEKVKEQEKYRRRNKQKRRDHERKKDRGVKKGVRVC